MSIDDDIRKGKAALKKLLDAEREKARAQVRREAAAGVMPVIVVALVAMFMLSKKGRR